MFFFLLLSYSRPGVHNRNCRMKYFNTHHVFVLFDHEQTNEFGFSQLFSQKPISQMTNNVWHVCTYLNAFVI